MSAPRALLLAAAVAGCASGGTSGSAETAGAASVEAGWVSLPVGGGETTNLLVLPPEGAPRGVVIAFPWGRGDAGLLAGLVETYWNRAAPARGYAVVGVETYGPGLDAGAERLMPALLAWIRANLPGAEGRVVLTGASAGGIGVFHAALAAPNQVHAILAMPGRADESLPLGPLAGTPVRLLVGELDGRWVSGSESTARRLQQAGALVELEIVPGQGHVLRVPQVELADWIERTAR